MLGTDGVPPIKEGGIRTVRIPPELAYGEGEQRPALPRPLGAWGGCTRSSAQARPGQASAGCTLASRRAACPSCFPLHVQTATAACMGCPRRAACRRAAAWSSPLTSKAWGTSTEVQACCSSASRVPDSHPDIFSFSTSDHRYQSHVWSASSLVHAVMRLQAAPQRRSLLLLGQERIHREAPRTKRGQQQQAARHPHVGGKVQPAKGNGGDEQRGCCIIIAGHGSSAACRTHTVNT